MKKDFISVFAYATGLVEEEQTFLSLFPCPFSKSFSFWKYLFLD
jgi:hypothetical protein